MIWYPNYGNSKTLFEVILQTGIMFCLEKRKPWVVYRNRSRSIVHGKTLKILSGAHSSRVSLFSIYHFIAEFCNYWRYPDLLCMAY